MEDPVLPVSYDGVQTLNGMKGTGGQHMRVPTCITPVTDENSLIRSTPSTKDTASHEAVLDQVSAPRKPAASSEGMSDWIDSLRKLLDRSTTVEDLSSLNSFLIAVRTQIRDEVTARVAKKEDELLELVSARDQELARLQEVLRGQQEIFEKQVERERQRYTESLDLSERRAKEQDHKYAELKSFVEILRAQSAEASERLCRELELVREKELQDVTFRERRIADQRVKEEEVLIKEQGKHIDELQTEFKEEAKARAKQLEETQKRHEECMQLMDNTAHEILATRLHELGAVKDEEIEAEREKHEQSENNAEETIRNREEAFAHFEAEAFEKEAKWLSSFGKVKHLKCVRVAFNEVIIKRRSRPNPEASPSPTSTGTYSVSNNERPQKRSNSNTPTQRHRFMDLASSLDVDKSVGNDYCSVDAPRRHSDENMGMATDVKAETRPGMSRAAKTRAQENRCDIYAPLLRERDAQRRYSDWEAAKRSKSQPRSQRSSRIENSVRLEEYASSGNMEVMMPADNIPTMVTQPCAQASGSYGVARRSTEGTTDQQQQRRYSVDLLESQANRFRGTQTDLSVEKRGPPHITVEKVVGSVHDAGNLILRDGSGEFVIRKEQKLRSYKEVPAYR